MNEQQTYHVAVVGATGAVGQTMLETLEKRQFPVGKLTLLSSERSAGKKRIYNNETYEVQVATPEAFEGVDIALFSAGGSVSKKLAKEAVKRGAVVIDNTSAFRMDQDVPLVVPEVNPDALKDHQGIIANPNCSTIQMVAALKPIQEKFGLKRVIVSTYQAVSGAGTEAIEEMKEQSAAVLEGKTPSASVLPAGGDKRHFPIAFNAIPQIDLFQDNGYTFEEMKMINETKKILQDESLSVAATCVRLPIESGHAESVYFETEADRVGASEVQNLLRDADGVTLQDDPASQEYPMPAMAAGKNDVFVGRIRKDLNVDNGIHMWVVADNLLKGAALNSVQIAEKMIELGLMKSK
ncbi:aspartate-semialdehyde dehydrogenase [Bacillaceae bacterium SIJ1]|uniref:aspartate-semialdehyde dehydrogenase n=1 Tax=Litoribacterium kuwaitense TaxID=1398745 RepID=UPI0013EDDBF4|nr:aspartate-semialdehyde dehydrogenase [Litoribacterium kuwaitense]NGP44078.1 aspartate-semialdehyde dehydrogenase [Litoribacterium kuwaitense]